MNYLRHKFYNLLAIIIVLFISVSSGTILLTFLGFGLYGLSRTLIYPRLGDFIYSRSMHDNLPYHGSYTVFGYLVVFAAEHLMDYFREMLPEGAYFRGATFHLTSYMVVTTLFYSIIHLNYMYINIDFWVIMVIVGFLYVRKLQFYPESKNLNNRK